MEAPMTVVSARLPDELVRNIDETAQSMNQSRADIIRRAVELYLADVEEQWSTLDRLSVPTGLTFDWEEVEALLTKD
jgi:predicted transcriptional regulator